jgi:hypothetical protein
MGRRVVLLAACLAATLIVVPNAFASGLVTRNAKYVSLKVDKYNRALVSYYQDGAWHHTLWWGAINAKYPDPAAPKSQYRFRYDYSGGHGSFGDGYWKTMKNVCGPYKGPRVPNIVKACTMTTPDHSNWVLQSWQRLMPNGGWACCKTWEQGKYELHLSHFSGPSDIAKLWLKWNWTGALHDGFRLDQLYGRISWLGRGYYGWTSDRYGDPTDSFGELIYVDTYNSRWGAGWRRINSFLSHYKSDGSFCDQTWPSRFGRTNSPGMGTRYRAFADGPGVTPMVEWVGPPPGNYGASAGLTRPELAIYSMNLNGPRKAFDQTQYDTFWNEQYHLFSSDDICRTRW